MSLPSWLRLALSEEVARRSAMIAIIVGPTLTVINQGDDFLAGEGLNWWKVVLTFLVPYLVATFGALGTARGAEAASASIEAGGGAASLKARVHVTLKSGVLDPQGKAIQQALTGLGFAGVLNVREGKVIELDLGETDPAKARSSVEAMCERLLANTVIETYAIELDG